MFKKILIANRGEIALRVIRACKELGIKTVAVYSVADKESLHVRFADEAVCIGPAPSNQSYLSIPNIIAAAEITNADAIHPGYGFLSENAKFSQVCADYGIKFIGASAEMINSMGDKASAKDTMKKAGVPCIPGSDGLLGTIDEGIKLANKVKYPVILKATAGGGGRGMRIIRNDGEFEKAWNDAKQEAGASFGNDGLYLEKFIEDPRHIEIQLLGDKFGTVIHLSERDCSIQRRHQKLVEETPSPIITERLRNKMGEAAVKGAKSIKYEGAGTIEFLVDKNGDFYFMEMNTRIQVEHPVTEGRTGVDLISEQIRHAQGEISRFKQSDIIFRNHVMEFRINAENYKTGMPSPGHITHYHRPGGIGVRTDDFIYTGYTVPPYYDSMISKIIVQADNRANCITRAKRVLDETVVSGIQTNIDLHKEILNDPDFVESKFSTNYLAKKLI